MSLLNFKNPFSKNPPEPQDYLSLTIAPNKIIATIWNFQGDNVHVLSTAEKEFANIDSVIHEAAVAIDNAAQVSKTDVSKVVFGLSQYWFIEDKLKPEAARALKPIDERTVFGKAVMLFDGVPREQVASFGEVRNPGIADLFVATMKGTYA